MSRCEKHDLEIISCADCRPRPGYTQATAAAREDSGPWFIAAYDGTCSGCGEDIAPDDEIRADGQGRWERRECCGEQEDRQSFQVIREPVRLVSWGLDPAHPGYANLTQPPTRRSP